MSIERDPNGGQTHPEKEKPAERTAIDLLQNVFGLGAEVNTSGIVSLPYDTSSETDLLAQMNQEMMEGGIAVISRPVTTGGVRKSFIIPKGAIERLALEPPTRTSRALSPGVSLISILEYGLAVSQPLLNYGPYAYDDLITGLTEEFIKKMNETGINIRGGLPKPRTYVKDALRKLANQNGTCEVVAKKLTQQIQENQSLTITEVPPSILSSIGRRILGKK